MLLSLYAVTALASAKDDYDEAVRLFRKGDYRSAIAGFESAEKKGMSSAALYYNLGSAHFKLEQYAASKKYFQRVTEYPDRRALAEFNLGMIAIVENDRPAALRHFEYTAANSGDEKLANLARSKIEVLQQVERRWSVYVNAYYGYDNNISVTPDNLAVGVADTFFSLYGTADAVVHGHRQSGWLADAAYFRVDFADEDTFDQSFYTVGIRKEHRLSTWDTVAHLKYGNSTFGDEDFQSFYQVDIHGIRRLSRLSKILLQYRYDDFTNDNPIFDYLEGWRQRAQIRYYRNTKKSGQQAYVELESNERNELVLPDYSYDYSPTRYMVGGKYTHSFTPRWHLIGDASYRVSYFPPSSTLDRDDTRWLFSILLSYHVNRNFQLKGDLKHINNDSTVDIYTYDRTVASLGFSLLF